MRSMAVPDLPWYSRGRTPLEACSDDEDGLRVAYKPEDSTVEFLRRHEALGQEVGPLDVASSCSFSLGDRPILLFTIHHYMAHHG